MNKQVIIDQILILLNMLAGTDANTESETNSVNEALVEMLTVKECLQEVKGITEHSIRQLVNNNMIPFVRAGQGKRGKILIPKAALLAYYGGDTK